VLTARERISPEPRSFNLARVILHTIRPRSAAYAGIEVGGMLISDDSGYTWTPAKRGLTDMDVHEILASEQIPGWFTSRAAKLASAFRPRRSIGKTFRPRPTITAQSVAEDRNGGCVCRLAKGRPNQWIREERRHCGNLS